MTTYLATLCESLAVYFDVASYSSTTIMIDLRKYLNKAEGHKLTLGMIYQFNGTTR